MKFTPKNRRLLLESLPEEENKTSDGILLPESVNKKEKTVFKLLSSAIDCNLILKSGQLVLVDPRMVEEDEVFGIRILTILEQHVKGVIKND
jgi:co-chaperonin GroES (HSP10)